MPILENIADLLADRSDLVADLRAKLVPKGKNMRPVFAGMSGLKPEMQVRVWRSAALTSADKPFLDSLVKDFGGVYIIDLRPSGSNPTGNGITSYRCGLTTAGSKSYEYGKFATGTAQRASLLRAITKTIAGLDKGYAILIHCAKGKDRTGVFCYLLRRHLGDSTANNEASYMLSAKAWGKGSVAVSWLRVFVRALNTDRRNIASEGGKKTSAGAFIRGLGVKQADLDKLVTLVKS